MSTLLFVLAITVGWLGLALLLLAGINAYRGRLERRARQPMVEEHIATIYLRSGKLVYRRRRAA